METSHPLRTVQEQTLKPFIEKFGRKIQWHDNLDALTPTDEQYTMVLAHEFFDALPFHLIEVRLTVKQAPCWFSWSQRDLKMDGGRSRSALPHTNPTPRRFSHFQARLLTSSQNKPKVISLIRISTRLFPNPVHLLRSSVWLRLGSGTSWWGRAWKFRPPRSRLLTKSEDCYPRKQKAQV